MSNMDEAHQNRKMEKASFWKQGDTLKSRIKFSNCRVCGATITQGTICRRCAEGGTFAERVAELNKHLCPRCKAVVTGGVTCARCSRLTAIARKKSLQEAGNLERLKAHMKRMEQPKRQKAPPMWYQNHIEKKMPKFRPRRL